MTREEAIWWVNHLFEIRKEEYFNKGMMKDAKEVQEAQHIAIEALSVDAVEVKAEQLPPKVPPEWINEGMVLVPQHDWIEMQKKLEEYVSAEAVEGKKNGSKLDVISRELAMERIANDNVVGGMERIKEYNNSKEYNEYLEGISDAITTIFCDVPSAETETNGDMGEVSDGYHTFNQLYHQRAVLFATIVKQNKEKAWKSWKHKDGKFCFDSNKEWFIVGVDTPEGSYTYHYEKKYWDMFDCVELEHGKFWDGHTEEDVTRLLSLN